MKPALLSLFATVFLASCSEYSKDYRTSATKFTKAKVSPTTPVGPWEGSWKSEVNGHHGPLWCLITQDPKNPDLWNFRYRAGWGILKFGDYTHPVTAKLAKDGSLALNHKMTLPNNFGTYTVTGKATPKKFDVRFHGNGDKGTMTLRRPAKAVKKEEKAEAAN